MSAPVWIISGHAVAVGDRFIVERSPTTYARVVEVIAIDAANVTYQRLDRSGVGSIATSHHAFSDSFLVERHARKWRA